MRYRVIEKLADVFNLGDVQEVHQVEVFNLDDVQEVHPAEVFAAAWNSPVKNQDESSSVEVRLRTTPGTA